MTATNSLSIFHQWLLAEPVGPASARAIILHGDSPAFTEHFIGEIADYLNEYDDDGAGHWLSATPGLVSQISDNPDLRRLLGMREDCPDCAPHSPCGIRKTLTALGQRGHVIFQSLIPPGKELDLPGAFHAGIGSTIKSAGKCHLVVNSDLMDRSSIAHIIGDVFLEWLHHELHRSGEIG